MLAAVDWQGIATLVAAAGAALSAIIGAMNRRSIRVPSGGSIGSAVERTHDLAAVATMSTMGAVKQGVDPPPVSPGKGLDDAVRRINDTPDSVIKVNGEAEGMHA